MVDEFEEKAKKFDVWGAVATSIITALSLTVGLFWKDVITATINELLPEGQTLFYQYVAAMAVTILAVIVSFFLLKTAEEARKLQLKEQKRIEDKTNKMKEEALIRRNERKKRFIKRFGRRN